MAMESRISAHANQLEPARREARHARVALDADLEGLADVEAANPFRLPRLHPGNKQEFEARKHDLGR